MTSETDDSVDYIIHAIATLRVALEASILTAGGVIATKLRDISVSIDDLVNAFENS